MPPEARKLVLLTLEGAEEHHGHVMARALVDKFDRFLKTFANFERVYAQVRARQTDFEVEVLSHNSPTAVGLYPVSRVRGYRPTDTIGWTLAQWAKISAGQAPDDLVDEDMIMDVAEMAKTDEKFGHKTFQIIYGDLKVPLGETNYRNAVALAMGRRLVESPLPWQPGKTKGSVIGQLKSILDADDQRQIVVCPPVGASQILCVFTDKMKDQVKDLMWSYVKIAGLLTYGSKSPHPILVEIETLNGVKYQKEGTHLSDGAGLFKDAVYENTWANQI